MGDGAAGARLPEEGQWIVDGPPLIDAVLPEGDIVAGTTPIVVLFNESMNPDSLVGAFELIPITGGLAGPPIDIPTFGLVGDGRMMVILPPARLAPAEYLVVVSAGAEVFDITGQQAALTAGDEIGTFGVDTADPVDMQVIATFPPDVATNQSETGEIVVVFDRPAQSTTVNADSIQVTIDGADPNSDPDPEALSLQQGGFSIPDDRVYTWRSIDAAGDLDPLPIGGQVLLEVSRVGFEITDATGAIVQPFVSSYTINDFARPLGAAILSQPTDAIGAANLTPGDAEELLVQIDLSAAEEGDILDLFLFGTSLDIDPRTIAFSRELTLTDPTPIDVAFYGLEELDLTISLNPVMARFANGPVAFAFRLRRGNIATSLRILDVDAGQRGIQDPLLDTVGPVVSEFFFANQDGSEVRSDQRDIVLGGRADEFVRAAEISVANLGDNGVLPSVIGIDEEGLFLAAPISVGVLPPGNVQVDLVTFDGAFNSSAPQSISFRQVGAVGPGDFMPGDALSVEVFDAYTLQPVEGALVVVHSDEGSSYPLVDSGLTDAGGLVSVMSAPAPSQGALVTVDAMGYDLFTFHGITSARLSLPLTPIGNEASATVSGQLTTSDPEAAFILNLFQRRIGDSRRPEGVPPFYLVDDCITDPFGTGEASCPYGPEAVRPGLLGVQTFIAGNFLQAEDTFLIDSLLTAFDIRFPQEILAPGDISTSEASIPFLLTSAPVEERPRELLSPTGGAVNLLVSGVTGFDFNDLVGDPTTTGDPFVTVEAIAPGIPGSFPVGIGAAFLQDPENWNLRAAFAGAVGSSGFFGANGLVDTDFFLRVELRDGSGNRIGARPRASSLDSLPLFGSVIPAGAPQMSLPIPGGNSGGQSFDIEFTGTLLNFYGQVGFYAVDLEDEAGRGWRLWSVDSQDSSGGIPEIERVHVPDLGGVGGAGLADGTIRVTIGVFGTPGLAKTEVGLEDELDDFLWSDIPRLHDVFARSAPVTFQKP